MSSSTRDPMQAFADLPARYAAMSGPRIEQENREKVRRAETEQEIALRMFLKERGRRYAACDFGNYEATEDAQRKALASLQCYVADISRHVTAGAGIVLYGPPGTGKDHLLVACARAALLAGHKVAWTAGEQMRSAFRDAMRDDRKESETMREWVNSDVLIVSDPQPPPGEKLGDYQAGRLYDLIDRRYNDCRPTWVSVNVAGSEELSKQLGPAVVDRLKDGALVIPCAWKSHRVKGEF